jgi:CheY-like chemotaxis protein
MSSISRPVLLVDDEPQIRMLVKSVLWEQGLSTIEAADGESALAAVHEAGGKIALLLTDVQMGQMSGIELALRVVREFPTIPVVFMSAWALPSELSGQILHSAFLQKPFSAARLTAAVRDALGA